MSIIAQSTHHRAIGISSSGGYVRGNVIIVSWRANRIKGNATVDELQLLA
jgi:hypothetical protein